MEKQTLFVAEEGGYAGYRIPAGNRPAGNGVIVFCEGRLGGLSDYGTIHILARISTDGGRNLRPGLSGGGGRRKHRGQSLPGF